MPFVCARCHRWTSDEDRARREAGNWSSDGREEFDHPSRPPLRSLAARVRVFNSTSHTVLLVQQNKACLYYPSQETNPAYWTSRSGHGQIILHRSGRMVCVRRRNTTPQYSISSCSPIQPRYTWRSRAGSRRITLKHSSPRL